MTKDIHTMPGRWWETGRRAAWRRCVAAILSERGAETAEYAIATMARLCRVSRRSLHSHLKYESTWRRHEPARRPRISGGAR